MPYYATLGLMQPVDKAGTPLPTDTPLLIVNAGLYINHGLLLGDLLSFDTSEGVEVIQSVDRAHQIYIEHFPDTEPPPKLLYTDDLEILDSLFTAIAARLGMALDSQGRPQGTAGAFLAASPLIEADAVGRLATASRHLDLLELKGHLEELSCLFRFAIEHQLLAYLE